MWHGNNIITNVGTTVPCVLPKAGAEVEKRKGIRCIDIKNQLTVKQDVNVSWSPTNRRYTKP